VSEPVDEDTARKAFSLVKALDSNQRLKAPSAFTVFRLYCMENRTSAQVAGACNCSKGRLLIGEDDQESTGTTPTS